MRGEEGGTTRSAMKDVMGHFDIHDLHNNLTTKHDINSYVINHHTVFLLRYSVIIHGRNRGGKYIEEQVNSALVKVRHHAYLS